MKYVENQTVKLEHGHFILFEFHVIKCNLKRYPYVPMLITTVVLFNP